MSSTDVYLATKGKGAHFNIKVFFPGKEISIRKICKDNQPWDSFLYTMGIPMLVKCHISIETGHKLMTTTHTKLDISWDTKYILSHYTDYICLI